MDAGFSQGNAGGDARTQDLIRTVADISNGLMNEGKQGHYWKEREPSTCYCRYSPMETCCWKISLDLQRRCLPTPLLVRSVVSSSVFNSHLTCCLPTLWGPTCTTRNLESSNSVLVHCSPIFCSLTKSTVHRRRRKLHCLKQWKKSKSPSKVYKLPAPFVVLATQNPIEQEGTYPLPEAQMDRFLMKMSMGYPDRAEEKAILARRKLRGKDQHDVEQITSPKKVVAMQKALETVHVDPAILAYIVEIVQRTEKTALSTVLHLVHHRSRLVEPLLQSLDVTMSFLMTSRVCIANHQPSYRHEARSKRFEC